MKKASHCLKAREQRRPMGACVLQRVREVLAINIFPHFKLVITSVEQA
jgi:hypothetical protein